LHLRHEQRGYGSVAARLRPETSGGRTLAFGLRGERTWSRSETQNERSATQTYYRRGKGVHHLESAIARGKAMCNRSKCSHPTRGPQPMNTPRQRRPTAPQNEGLRCQRLRGTPHLAGSNPPVAVLGSGAAAYLLNSRSRSSTTVPARPRAGPRTGPRSVAFVGILVSLLKQSTSADGGMIATPGASRAQLAPDGA